MCQRTVEKVNRLYGEMTEGLAGSGVDWKEADTGIVWYGRLTPKAGNGAWSLDSAWLLRLLACLL